jgi:hypothetical protein
MLIFRGGNWPEHRGWFITTLAVSAAAAAWYGAASMAAGRSLGGGSLHGLVTGAAGGLIVVFEIGLWPRKRLRTARIGRAKVWMKAHIWLGLLAAPLLVIHSGFHWGGGSLSDILLLSFLAVTASGVWGLLLQQFVPSLLLERVPGETIMSQIDAVLVQYLDEASRLVRATCGEDPEPARVPEVRSVAVVGAVRTLGRPAGGEAGNPMVRRVEGSEPLFVCFRESVAPYLGVKAGRASGLPLASASRAQALFQDLRERLDPAAHDVVDRLEGFCDRRRQFDLQFRIHGWLHNWLSFHVPLSIAMFLMMIAHVYYALYYL